MKPFLKLPFKYGIIAGVLGAILVIGLYYIGTHPFIIPVYLDYRIFLFGVFIFFSLKEFRDYYQGGILYFWQGVIASFFFTLIFAVIAGIGLWIFATVVPEFVSSYITLKTDEVKSFPPDIIAKIGREVYERNLALLPTTNALDLALLYFVQSFMISFFVSIILSVILRRQP